MPEQEMCRVCAGDEEILVRRQGGGVRALNCPACVGLAPLEQHAWPSTYEDAIEACALRGVTAHIAPLDALMVTRDGHREPLTDEVRSGHDDEWRPMWWMFGMRDPNAHTAIEIPEETFEIGPVSP